MKLRSKLFLSTSALLTVALLGLSLGIFSVLQLTQSQSRSLAHNLEVISTSLDLRQELGRQLFMMLSEDFDERTVHSLRESDQRIRSWLDDSLKGSMSQGDRQAILEIQTAYQKFSTLLEDPMTVRHQLLTNDDFAKTIETVRDRLNTLQIHYVSAVKESEAQSRDRAWLIAGLLGLVGLAVLVIGFITAHTIARRVGQPIDALARAADQIGRGDFQVTLPITPVAELSALSRRFGLMAESLRQLKSSNIEALMSEQRRLQAVLDSIDDGLLIFGRDGLLEHFNPVAQRQLGWDDQPLGQRPSQALGRPELDEQLQHVLQGHNLEQRLADLQVAANGETRLLNYSLTPVSHSQGHILGAVMVLHDVTEQRAFERARNEFVLRASHELRTPVTGMHMAFGLLRERSKFAEESREADLVRIVEEEMERLVHLIEDLLNFSRYQSGVQKLELAPCDIPELLDNAVRRHLGKAQARQIHMELEVAEALPRTHLDRAQIERVLDHLIDNALRHSPDGGTLRLCAGRQDERLLISVEDEGEGIAYGQQARLFEPFVQIGHKKGGAGLGLALCKEIVQLHGGRIGAESQPGQGARFHFALPL
ncbi:MULTISPECIES: KinB sensor domain-containing domain [unclassified Pseudomonas]|jgi:NtrC-family two-component system sensor histidine kinase KinB|uniref:KinB sensor domain-containing domain n=1 Tax=unclassified Pseudomonas TaxID=196821 RepID=UPI000DAD0BC4|nr:MULTISPECIES: KinB sensor domain-containing domain [unclassified Pseudomonas]PZW39946.1 PAS domain S-box-containing protein [Pseudomonas sp. URMO17WK12:I2]CAH0236498.1 Alginate biosynthesis sensor protein KinB [Pseudomonas sp. Bi70]